MDKGTLIDVVAMIDARINMYQKVDANDPFYKGAVVALSSLSEELQLGIEAAIAAMESSTGD
jgi:hypothetical protein